MSLIAYSAQPITIRVSDRVEGTTKLGQVATFRGFHWTRNNEGEDILQVVLDVSYWGIDEAGELVAPLQGRGIVPYAVTLLGANDTIVAASTGEILAVASSKAEAIELAESYEQDVMLQGDFFNRLAFHQPVVIAPMIVQHIQAADAMGKFS